MRFRTSPFDYWLGSLVALLLTVEMVEMIDAWDEMRSRLGRFWQSCPGQMQGKFVPGSRFGPPEEWPMKRMIALAVLLAGCASGPPAQIAGKYQGYFGGQMSDHKIGCSGELTQKGDVVYGKFHLLFQKDGSQADLDCDVDGTVKGKNVQLRLHGKQEKLEFQVTGDFITEGEVRILGSAYLEGRDGSLPALLKRL